MKIIRQAHIFTVSVFLVLVAFAWGLFWAYHAQKTEAINAKKAAVVLEQQLAAERAAMKELQAVRLTLSSKSAARKRRLDNRTASSDRKIANQPVVPVLSYTLDELRSAEVRGE